jgi:septum formation protein
MFPENLHHYHIILASQSPRRQILLKELGIEFEINTKNGIDESFPPHLQKEEIALFLAEEKAKAFESIIDDNMLVITADTIVWIDNEVLNKPTDYADALRMLKKLSGASHLVLTGVCLRSKNKKVSFFNSTEVHFKPLSDQEIHYYLENYKPYDKAGAYGIQEWIGYVGIDYIKGSYFNVMGLPIDQLYDELKKF